MVSRKVISTPSTDNDIEGDLLKGNIMKYEFYFDLF